jgi:hypothetical protein
MALKWSFCRFYRSIFCRFSHVVLATHAPYSFYNCSCSQVLNDAFNPFKHLIKPKKRYKQNSIFKKPDGSCFAGVIGFAVMASEGVDV